MAVATTVTQLQVLTQSAIAPTVAVDPLAPSGPMKSVGPGTGYEVWSMDGTDIGEAGGGDMNMLFRIPVDQRYYTVTQIYMSRGDTGIDALWRYFLTPSDWEAFFQSNLGGTVNQVLPLEDLGATVTTSRVDAFRGVYLGRARSPDADFVLSVTTNTDGITYRFRIVGVRSLQPGIPWFNVLQMGRVLT